MSVKIMASIVTPGTVVGTADKNSPGAGTTEQNGNLIALLTGTVVENDGVISIEGPMAQYDLNPFPPKENS